MLLGVVEDIEGAVFPDGVPLLAPFDLLAEDEIPPRVVVTLLND